MEDTATISHTCVVGNKLSSLFETFDSNYSRCLMVARILLLESPETGDVIDPFLAPEMGIFSRPFGD